MRRPPRLYRPAEIRCAVCHEYIVSTALGWSHKKRTRITDPDWHVAIPVQ